MVLTAEQRERMRISKERALAKRAERRETIAAQQRLQQQQHERPRTQQHQPQQQRRTTQTHDQPTSTIEPTPTVTEAVETKTGKTVSGTEKEDKYTKTLDFSGMTYEYTRECGQCHKTLALGDHSTTKICTCKSVLYCRNKTCQRTHWKQHQKEHKRIMKERKRTTAAAARGEVRVPEDCRTLKEAVERVKEDDRSWGRGYTPRVCRTFWRFHPP